MSSTKENFAKVLLASMAFLITAFSAPAEANLSDLVGTPKGWAVWSAVTACATPAVYLGGCKFQYEVIAGHRNHVKKSCHYTKEAVDIKSSPSCLHAMASCLQTQLYVLLCFQSYPTSAIANQINKDACKPADHQNHIHVQFYGGCEE